MYDLQHDLLEAYQTTSEILNGLLDGIGAEEARSARGGDENWSVVEVLCHLRDAEEFFIKRFQAMRDQDNPVITGYDQEALARDRNYKDADLRRTSSDGPGEFQHFSEANNCGTFKTDPGAVATYRTTHRIGPDHDLCPDNPSRHP